MRFTYSVTKEKGVKKHRQHHPEWSKKIKYIELKHYKKQFSCWRAIPTPCWSESQLLDYLCYHKVCYTWKYTADIFSCSLIAKEEALETFSHYIHRSKNSCIMPQISIGITYISQSSEICRMEDKLFLNIMLGYVQKPSLLSMLLLLCLHSSLWVLCLTFKFTTGLRWWQQISKCLLSIFSIFFKFVCTRYIRKRYTAVKWSFPGIEKPGF